MSSYFCLRTCLLASFVLLCISGVIVTTISGILVHNVNKDDYYPGVNNIEGPPGTLLAMGLLTIVVAVYFWFALDNKYNRPQNLVFTVLLSLISIIEATTGIWALIKQEQLNVMLSNSLKDILIGKKVMDMHLPMNLTDIKLHCCGFNETIDAMSTIDEINSWDCCNFARFDNKTKSICETIHGNECKHLKINKNRSVLHYSFLLALSSIFYQIFVFGGVIYYYKFLKKHLRKRHFEIQMNNSS